MEKLKLNIDGKPVFLDENGRFHCFIGGIDVEDTSFFMLTGKILEARIVEVSELAYVYDGWGGMDKGKVIRMHSDGTLIVKLLNSYNDNEKERNRDHLFPVSEHNEKILKETDEMKLEIDKMEEKRKAMFRKLERFPLGFWEVYERMRK